MYTMTSPDHVSGDIRIRCRGGARSVKRGPGHFKLAGSWGLGSLLIRAYHISPITYLSHLSISPSHHLTSCDDRIVDTRLSSCFR